MEPIPITVIGGFLGAGKTTLLNRLLTQTQGTRYAVIVNDFGDLAIDGDLVTGHGGDTLTFANGCLCCTMGDSLLQTLDTLLARAEPPEHFVVEASGVADPQQIADIGILHPRLLRDLVIVLVDAETIRERAEDPRLADTIERQLQSAGLVVLNKCDLVPEAERAQVRDWMARHLPGTPVVETDHARLPAERLIGPGASQPARAREAAPEGHAPHAHEPDHGTLFRGVSVAFERPLEPAAFRATLSGLPPSVLRAKGFVAFAGEPERLQLVQLSGGHLQITPWPEGAGARGRPATAIELIGTADMPPAEWLREKLQAAMTAGPEA